MVIMVTLRIFYLAFLVLTSCLWVSASVNESTSWLQVAPIVLEERLVEANPGGRAALCSWINEDKHETTILVAVKNKFGNHGIKKLVYTLTESKPKITSTNINLKQFIPRTILRTDGGILYLTANSGIDDNWSDLVSGTQLRNRPKPLEGSVWVSSDNGNNWIELEDGKNNGIMNASYMACYKTDTEGAVGATTIRVGGVGIASTEITCFISKENADKYKNSLNKLLKETYKGYDTKLIFSNVQSDPRLGLHFVIATSMDSALIKEAKKANNPLFTRIGELPIDSNGTDLKYNIINFRYNSLLLYGHKKKDGLFRGRKTIGTVVALGTPIFGDYSSQSRVNNIDYSKYEVNIDDGEHTDSEGGNFAVANGYYYFTGKSDEPEINGKYRNCVVTYDNTGLMLTGEWRPIGLNGIMAYFGSVDEIKSNHSNAKPISSPQEVVAQYNGFMAVAHGDGADGLQVSISKNNDFINTKFDDKMHDYNKKEIYEDVSVNRLMLSGINSLGWHSDKNIINKYNGKLIAIGQFNEKICDQTLLKLHMAPTVITVSKDCAYINGQLVGEPYARVKYWWQRSTNGNSFVPLTYDSIKDQDIFVESGEVFLDSNGKANIEHVLQNSGYYRLIASAIVGGFYCDREIPTTNSVINFNNIGSVSKVIEITLRGFTIANPSMTYANNGMNHTAIMTKSTPNRNDSCVVKTKIASIFLESFKPKRKDESLFFKANDILSVCPNSDIFFSTSILPTNSSVNWLLDDHSLPCSATNCTHNFMDNGEHNNAGNHIVQFVLNEMCGPAGMKGYFNIKVPSILEKPIIIRSNFDNKNNHQTKYQIEGIKHTILSVAPSKNYTQVWKVKNNSSADWDILSERTSLMAPHIASRPALNPNPSFDDRLNGWLAGDWVVVNDNTSGVSKVLMGTSAHKLFSDNFISVDAKRNYLYIAAARATEDNMELTLSVECYGKDKQKLADINLPKEVLTNAWSSYGGLINKDKNYLFPTGTVFVKLALHLPESTQLETGTYVSAIRLIEIPEETQLALKSYIDNTIKWNHTEFSSIAKCWDCLVGRNATGNEKVENCYKVITADSNGCMTTSESDEICIAVEKQVYFHSYTAHIINNDDYESSILKLDPDLDKYMTATVNDQQDLKLTAGTSSRDSLQYYWYKASGDQPLRKGSKKDITWEMVGNGLSYILPKSECLVNKEEITLLQCRAIVENPDKKDSKIYRSRIFQITKKRTELAIKNYLINNQPTTTASLSPGDSVRLKVELANTPSSPVTYQWFFSGINTRNQWIPLSGADRDNLLVSAKEEVVDKNIIEKYKVKVSNYNDIQKIDNDIFFLITHQPKSPKYVFSGDSYQVASGSIGNGDVIYRECVNDDNKDKDGICDKNNKINYPVIKDHNLAILAAGPALNVDPIFTKCNHNDCLEQIVGAQMPDGQDNEECNVSLAEEVQSPYFGKTIKISCGDVTVRNKDFTLITKDKVYLIIANGHSSRDNAKIIISASAYDKDKKSIGEDITIDEATIGVSWTSFGGLVRIQDRDKGKVKSLPQKTVYIKYKIRFNLDDKISDGYLSNVRIIAINDEELKCLEEISETESLAQFWDRRAGADPYGTHNRVYHYYSESKYANVLHDEVTVIGKPKLAIALQSHDTDVAGGSIINAEARVTPHGFNLYNFTWQVKYGEKAWESVCDKSDTETQSINQLKKIVYKTKLVDKPMLLTMRLMAATVNGENKEKENIYSNIIMINLYPKANQHIPLYNVVTCINSDAEIALDKDVLYKHVQWQIAESDKDFKDHPGANDYKFKLPTERSGNYKVRVNVITSYNQAIQSDTAIVTIEEGVQITQHPQSLNIYQEDSTAFLEVAAAGDNTKCSWEYRIGAEAPWRSVKDLECKCNLQSNANKLEVCVDHHEVSYRARCSNDNSCSSTISNIATVTTFPNFELDLKGQAIVLAGNLAYFHIDAPIGTEIAWDVYEANSDGSNQDKDFTYAPDSKTIYSKENSVKLLIPSLPGFYTVKATVVNDIRGTHKSFIIGIYAILNGSQGISDFEDERLTGLSFVRLQAAMGSKAGDSNYDADMDANGDGLIDEADEALFREKFQKADAKY